MQKQPWISSARYDVGFILAPAFLITSFVFMFSGSIQQIKDFPPWLWGFLILGVDVSHVYSTLFRTYFDKEEFRARQNLYILVPLIGWVVGCILYSMGSMVFWRVLAYIAAFHFVRQQYGFMMIYSRAEREYHHMFRMIDKISIYSATIFPLLYWHLHSRNFDWFIKGDFFSAHQYEGLTFVIEIIYVSILLLYFLKEIFIIRKFGFINIPKNLLFIGTVLSWYVGIVMINHDIAFTAINVISHGIPYMALIWLYGRNQNDDSRKASLYFMDWIGSIFKKRFYFAFIGILIFLAYAEEAIWDALVWRDHSSLFIFSNYLPVIRDHATLSWLVPLLALPQITHYILDAYIWRMQTLGTQWKEVLFLQANRNL